MDFTNSLPDDCLDQILSFLTSSNDRNNASLVSHRWLRIDARTRARLTLKAPSDLLIFTRFNSFTHLVLNKDSKSGFSINDNDIIRITSMCPHLTRLKLRYCQQLTDSCMPLLSKNCNKLKEFSCDHCSFTDFGMVHFLDNSSQLEVLSVDVLEASRRYSRHKFQAPKSLKVIQFTSVNSELFVALILCSKNLKSFKAITCFVNLDKCFQYIPKDSRLVELHLEQSNVTDTGLKLLSKRCDLEELHIIRIRVCTNSGLYRVAENCKGLKKLYIRQRNWISMGDRGLIAVGKHSLNLQELVLDKINASCVSLEAIATNCKKLVKIALSRSLMITDMEMSCIAKKCVALKFLSIEACSVSNKGIEALGQGCPNLVNLSVTRCRKVTHEAEDLLRAKRGSLVVKFGFSW